MVFVRVLPLASVRVSVIVLVTSGTRPSSWNSWVLLYCDSCYASRVKSAYPSACTV